MWLLDKNVPIQLAALLGELGVEAATADSKGFGSLTNGELVVAAVEAVVSSIPGQRGAAMAERAGLQPGEPVAAVGAAEEDWSLVTDQLATAAGEDGRAVDETCALLLAAVRGRASDAAGVRGDSPADLGAAPADWIGRRRRGRKQVEGRGWEGEVSEKSLA